MKENGVGTASPGCGSNCDQSMVRPSSRGGVPVFNRVQCKPSVRSWSPSNWEGASPFRPQLYVMLADVRQPVEERPGGDDHGAGIDSSAVPQQNAGHPPVLTDLSAPPPPPA